MCAAAPAAFAQAVGLQAIDLAGPLLSLCTRIDHYQFNRLMGAGLGADTEGKSLEEAARRFRDAGLKNGYLQVAPGAHAPTLESRAGALGLQPLKRTWVKFSRGVEAAPAAPTSLTIEVVKPGEAIGFAGAVQASAGRKGGQAALLARRIADGLRLGVTGFVTETGKPLAGEPHPSYSNIQRSGFVIAYERRNWILPQSA